MDNRLKAAVLVVIIGGGAFMGWRFLQDKAAGASDDDLFTNYSLALGADATSPYNKEAHKRVESQTMKWDFLLKKAQDRDEKVRQIAFNMMAHVPKHLRDDVLKVVEGHWVKYSVPEVREQMVYAIKECALNGMTDKGKAVMRFLATTAWDPKVGVSQDTEKVIVRALKEIAEEIGDPGAVGHNRTDWVSWYTRGGAAKFISDESSNKRGKNK